MRARALAYTAVLALTFARNAHAVGPHRSWSQLPSGNGRGFAVYDVDRARLTTLTNHPYAQRTPSERTRDVAFDAYFGVRANGGGYWLGERPVTRAEYVQQTHVVRAEQSAGPLATETFVYAPFAHASPGVVLALRVRNTSRSAVPDASAYALLNFHLGSGDEPGTDGERVRWDNEARAFTETGASGLSLSYVPFGEGELVHGASPANPYPAVLQGGDLANADDSGTRDDAVAGFQWRFGALGPGESRSVAVLVTFATAREGRAFVADRAPYAMVEGEVRDWEAWRVAPPAGLSPAETRVYRQSESVLRMAQSREEGAAGGQLIASLPPGIWSIAWTRDMSYALVALARSGHTEEARRGLQFFRTGRVGSYRSYVGADYPVSVVRYYGDGGEWSDEDETGPNVEFDGFGLAAWAARAAGEEPLPGTAPLLGSLIDETGLVKPDSSIWEVHWNGREKRFAYTSITAAHGLCLAGDANGARALRDAITRRLVLSSGGIAANYEELRSAAPARDAAVVEAINFGLLPYNDPLVGETLDELERLRVATGRGFKRNDDGGGYDEAEWLFVDLRAEAAMRRAGRTQQADELLAWVTAQAEENYGIIPELFHPRSGDYEGAIPMVGFGAGAYLLSVHDRANPEARNEQCFPAREGVSSGGASMSAGGCSVRGVGAKNGWGWGVVAMAAAMAGRRRKR